MARTLHPDAALFDHIGRSLVREEFRLTYQALHNWRFRGVPETNRPAFADFARAHGVTLPKDFLKPRHQRANNDKNLTMRSPNARP